MLIDQFPDGSPAGDECYFAATGEERTEPTQGTWSLSLDLVRLIPH